MEKFSFKRFWNVFHYEYSRMRTVYVVILAVVVAAIIICDSVLMFPKVFGQSFRFVVKVLLDGMTVFMYAGLFCTLSMFIFAGQNKLMIADLMQPASNAEKFSAKFTVYWLIPALFALALIWLTPYVMEHYEM
ncbi:MAG: hypothetical protein J5595_00865, partial [Bacteroidales bacterium]|nr:hypothetical protein [Bacteroidales bacterium]